MTRPGVRTRFVTALVIAATMLGAGASPSHAQRRGGRGRGGGQTQTEARTAESGFQTPSQERSVAPEEEPEDAIEERTRSIEDIEAVAYLRERPDSLGAAAREYQDSRLAELLASREQLRDERREEAIRLLEAFIASEPADAAEMPDALLRLAELRFELSRLSYVRAFGAWQEQPEASRGPEPTIDYRVPLALYERLITGYPTFERLDLVYYMKAYALLDSGRTEEALDVYRRILAQFPSSRFVPDAHFAIAEDAFTNQADFAAALVEYEAVIAFPRSELYDVSLFKSAWCLWRLGRTDQAAVRFRQVLDLGSNTAGLTAEQRRRLGDLQDEALDYLIQVFTEDESNTAQDVFGFLAGIGGDRYANRVLRRLADTYLSQGRNERAVEAYGLLLQMNPTVPEAPEYQRTIALAYARMGESDEVVTALTTLASTYGPTSPWAAQQGDPETVERAQVRIERAVRRQALRFHEQAQRDNDRVLFEKTAQLYAVYQSHFSTSEHAYDLKFYEAEVLFHRLSRYPEAGVAYLAAARMNPQGQYTRDALYNAIGAFERVREQEINACAGTAPAATQTPQARTQPQPAQPATAPTTAPSATASATAPRQCDETENDRRFSEAIALYVELFPDDPDLPEILFRQGRLYYDRRIYDPAIRLFGQLIERYPQSPFAVQAGELILESFNRARDYANIETWARRLKESPAFAAAEYQQKLDRLILQAVFARGEQLAEAGSHAEAAVAYNRAAEEFPNDPRARQALYNAGLESQRAGDLDGAARAYTRLAERYAGSSEGATGTWQGAQMFESIAQFRDAAAFYERYGERFPRGEHAADAMYNAVVLRVAAHDWDDAAEAARAFLERNPRHESADDVTFYLARALEGDGETREAAEVYRDYARRSRNPNRQIEAFTRLGQMLQRDGQTDQANQAFDEAVRLGKRNRRTLREGLYFAAQARFLQGEQVIARYERIAIAGETATLRNRLEQKSTLLREASVIFADVVSFGVAEWVTAALYRIGESYETFARSMNEFEIPEGLSDAEEQSYRDQLAAFVIPMEERALEAYEGGYRQAIELRIFNRWTALLREGLVRLNEVEHPPLREIGYELVEAPPLPVPQPLDGLRRRTPAPAEGEAAPTEGASEEAER